MDTINSRYLLVHIKDDFCSTFPWNKPFWFPVRLFIFTWSFIIFTFTIYFYQHFDHEYFGSVQEYLIYYKYSPSLESFLIPCSHEQTFFYSLFLQALSDSTHFLHFQVLYRLTVLIVSITFIPYLLFCSKVLTFQQFLKCINLFLRRIEHLIWSNCIWWGHSSCIIIWWKPLPGQIEQH